MDLHTWCSIDLQLEWNLTCPHTTRQYFGKMSLSLYVAFTILGGSCRVSLEDSEMEAEHVSSQTPQPWLSCLFSFSTAQFHHRNSWKWWRWKAEWRLLSSYESILITSCLVNKAKMIRAFSSRQTSLWSFDWQQQIHFLTGKDKTETADP